MAGAFNDLFPLAQAVMTNPVGTERAPLPGVLSMGMQRGPFDPILDPGVARWPGRPMTEGEYQGVRNASLDLFGQAAMLAGTPAARQGAGVAAMERRLVPMAPAPRQVPESGTPEVWAPQPYSVAPVYNRPAGTPGYRTWTIKDYRGEKAGGIDTTWNPDTGNLHIENIDAYGGPNSLGTAAIRQLREALLEQYPQARTLTGLRISGATYAHKNSGAGPGRDAIQYVAGAQQ